MLKKCKIIALVFCILVYNLCAKTNNLFLFVSYADSFLIVKSTNVNIRSGPGTNYNILGTATLGYRFLPTATVKDNLGGSKSWYKFSYNGSDAYIRSDFCKQSATYVYDATFEADLNMKGFPESYKVYLRDVHATYPNWTFTLFKTGLDFNYAVENELIGTRTLVRKNTISSYKSTDNGKYDWTTSQWPTFDGTEWVCASKEITMYNMDPRNFLYEPYIFQFEHQTFNSSIHTIDGIKEMVKGTFLDDIVSTSGANNNNFQIVTNDNIFSLPLPNGGESNIFPETTTDGTAVIPILQNVEKEKQVYAFSNIIIPDYNAPGTSIGPGANIANNNNGTQIINQTSSDTNDNVSFGFTYLQAGQHHYAELIYDACRQVNVNPYVIVSMILQENGKNGSGSTSGQNATYPGIYNYGNINSYTTSSQTAIENGLKYASETGSYNRPWNTKEKGIYGLCDFYATSYVKVGQDTFYLKKWNVQGENIFKHQYMTNVAGAVSEGQILGSSYDEKMLQAVHEFKIPYYENMPENRCEAPTKDGSPNNKLKSLNVQNFILTPTFDKDTFNYSLVIDNTVSGIQVSAEPYDNKAAISGTGYINIVTTNTNIVIQVVAENGDKRQYNINVYKKGVENVVNENSYISPIIVNQNVPPIGDMSGLTNNDNTLVIPIIGQ